MPPKWLNVVATQGITDLAFTLTNQGYAICLIIDPLHYGLIYYILLHAYQQAKGPTINLAQQYNK